MDAGAFFGWAANLLITFNIFHLEAQIIFLQPMHGIDFGFFCSQGGAECSLQQPAGNRTPGWGCVSSVGAAIQPLSSPCSVLELSVVQAEKLNFEGTCLLVGCA